MSVRVVGLDKAIRDIRKKFKGAESVIVGVLEDTAANIEIDAKMDAPSEIVGVKLDSKIRNKETKKRELVNLKQRIDKIPSLKGLRWRIGVQGAQDFDMYAEAGTGQSAREILNSPGYTQEMRDMAMLFYKTGRGTLRGSPYLFPNWIKHTANLVEELRKDIADAVR